MPKDAVISDGSDIKIEPIRKKRHLFRNALRCIVLSSSQNCGFCKKVGFTKPSTMWLPPQVASLCDRESLCQPSLAHTHADNT